MWDYFLGYDEFETEEEIYELFNTNEYLKKYLEMKEKLIKKALELL